MKVVVLQAYELFGIDLSLHHNVFLTNVTLLLNFGLLHQRHRLHSSVLVVEALQANDLVVQEVTEQENGESHNLNQGSPLNLLSMSMIEEVDDNVDYNLKMLSFDPQTSGGLFICADKSNAENILADLWREGIDCACIIGKVKNKEKEYIHLTK